MGKPGSQKHSYNERSLTGFSGQMAVVAELLIRGCNAAVPELDVGTDIFAFKDDRPEVARIQVKACQGTRGKGGNQFRARFSIPLRQLRAADEPPLYYALAVRLGDLWSDFLIISRSQLLTYNEDHADFGHENKGNQNLELSVLFSPERVTCGRVDVTAHRHAWKDLPPVAPPVPVPTSGAVDGTAVNCRRGRPTNRTGPYDRAGCANSAGGTKMCVSPVASSITA